MTTLDLMGSKNRRGTAAAAVAAAAVVDSHSEEELDPPVAAAAAEASTGSQPEKRLDPTAAPPTGKANDADHIITFVKEIERENEFFEFEDYLKQRVDFIQPDSNKIDIFLVLVQKERIHKQYDNLEFQDMVNVINGRIVDLRIERGCKEDISLRSALLKNDVGQGLNPFRELVKAVREKGYIMDEDPFKELNIIKNHHPSIYYNYFRQRTVMKNLENQVRVKCVPVDYDEEQVKAAFSSCGEIVDVKLERERPWATVAYITFKESEGAKIAPFLMHRTPFSIYPVREYRELATDSELREALKSYDDFRLSAKLGAGRC